MKIHRFIDDFDLKQKEVKITKPALVRQLFLVLKIQPGEQVVLSDGEGKEARGIVKKASKDKYIIALGKSSQLANASRQVNLYCAILKKENFELVVQKVTELGVDKIVPILTERTVKLNLNGERLRKIAREASEQSGQSKVPQIIEPMKLVDALTWAKTGLNIFFQQDGRNFSELEDKFNKSKVVNIFIGPEGGWTSLEISLAKAAGAQLITLNKNTLRGETAAIVATFLVCA